MDSKVIVELIGYLGSALVLVSMLMTSVVRLRIINLIGSVIFSVYALLIQSYPTAVMNFCLAGINIYHLHRLMKEQKQYDLIRTGRDDAYLSFLINRNLEDIRKWLPEFSGPDAEADLSFLVSCDGNPACVFLGRTTAPGEVEVVLDYATPVYRDTTVGRFLYQQLAKDGFRTLTFRQSAPDHIQYMEKVGYKKTGENEYVLDLTELR